MQFPFSRAVKLHGHLGPNLVLGAKMAIYARTLLGNKKISAVSSVSGKPPEGCINDGLRVLCASVSLTGRGEGEVTFSSGDRTVTLAIKPTIQRIIGLRIKEAQRLYGLSTAYFREMEHLGHYFLDRYPPEALFDVQGKIMHSPEGTRE